MGALLNTVLYEFVWGGPDRIKREVLVKEYNEGGLKMTCIKSILQAQKIKCVTRLFTSNSIGWKNICLELLSPVGGEYIFYCNFDMKYLNIEVSKWFKEILETWSLLNRKTDTANQCIWNNKTIILNGKSIFKSEIKEKGFVKIADMLDEFGRPLRWKDCKEKDLKFTEYFGLLDCYTKIPGAWKHFFLQQNYHHLVKDLRDFTTIFCDSEIKQIHNIMTKQLYRTFLRLNNPEISKVFTRFNELYNMNEQQVSNLFTLPANVTIDSRLRITHYTILNNLIPTNEWLARIGRKNSALCSFCNATRDNGPFIFYMS